MLSLSDKINVNTEPNLKQLCLHSDDFSLWLVMPPSSILAVHFLNSILCADVWWYLFLNQVSFHVGIARDEVGRHIKNIQIQS